MRKHFTVVVVPLTQPKFPHLSSPLTMANLRSCTTAIKIILDVTVPLHIKKGFPVSKFPFALTIPEEHHAIGRSLQHLFLYERLEFWKNEKKILVI